MNRRGWWLAAAILALLWVFAVVAFYYFVHRPFDLVNVLAMGQGLAGLVGAGLVAVLGTGIGVVLLRRMVLPSTERLIVASAVGLGALALLGLGLGAVGLLRPWLLWVLTAAGLVATGRPLWQALRAAWADPAWRPRDRLEGFLAACCVVMAVFALIWALAPPTAWDSLDYHLTGPKLYLETGWVSHPFDLPHLGFPQLVEMLFAWGMGLVGERAAAPIHWWYGMLTALALVVIGRRWLVGATGWLAAAVLLSASSVVVLAGKPYVDLALLLYTTLAFWALAHFLWSGPQTRWWLVLSGALAGLALSTKYTALALLPALGLSLLVSRIRRPWVVVRSACLLGIIALVVWAPWLVKNLVLTGNPTYPFFFGGIYWDAWRTWWYDRPATGLAYTEPWRLLVAPWDATIWGLEGASLVGLPSYGATIGPLLLVLCPLLFLVWGRFSDGQRRWLRAGLVFCGVLYGFWLWGVARSALLIQTRLLLPAFGLLALMAGAAVEGLRAPSRPIDLGWVVRAVVVGVLVLSLVSESLFVLREQPWRVLLGFEGEEEYLTRKLGWQYVAVDYINRELPEDAVVLFLWEERSFYCQVTCWPDSLLDRWLHATHLHRHDAQAIAEAWRTEGVTHVLFYQQGYEAVVAAGFDPISEADVTALETLRRDALREVQDFDGIYVLYRLGEP